MLSRIKEMFHTFSYVVTGVLFACALFLTIFNKEGVIPANLLWQILSVSFLCTIGNFIYPHREITKRQHTVCRLLHYLYTNAVVFGSARIFRWFDADSLKMNVAMVLLIMTVFYTVSYTIQRQNRKLSALLNEHLEQYQSKIEQEEK